VAREHLVAGLDLAGAAGADVLAERARAEAVAAGARPRRPRSSGAGALTPAELRVARLAAQGMTNRQIAQSLFITLGTVKDHLGSAYRKLGIASREELAARLEPAG
jgi:DNA-binding CsgD family transcriptional regulator